VIVVSGVFAFFSGSYFREVAWLGASVSLTMIDLSAVAALRILISHTENSVDLRSCCYQRSKLDSYEYNLSSLKMY
jgi:hypothetical protein